MKFQEFSEFILGYLILKSGSTGSEASMCAVLNGEIWTSPILMFVVR